MNRGGRFLLLRVLLVIVIEVAAMYLLVSLLETSYGNGANPSYDDLYDAVMDFPITTDFIQSYRHPSEMITIGMAATIAMVIEHLIQRFELWGAESGCFGDTLLLLINSPMIFLSSAMLWFLSKLPGYGTAVDFFSNWCYVPQTFRKMTAAFGSNFLQALLLLIFLCISIVGVGLCIFFIIRKVLCDAATVCIFLGALAFLLFGVILDAIMGRGTLNNVLDIAVNEPLGILFGWVEDYAEAHGVWGETVRYLAASPILALFFATGDAIWGLIKRKFTN